MKTAIIYSADDGESFKFEYHFEDRVMFNEINFPRPAEKIIFEIKEVYTGGKGDNTCITGIITRNPDPDDY